MKAVYKRELGSYFNSMSGYIFVAAVTFITGIYFMVYNIYNGLPSFGYTLISVTFILMVTMPVLTMRSFAEERRNRTDQMLMTAPVSLGGVVMGKYLAMVTVFAAPAALMCACPLIIKLGGNAALTADYSSLLAFFLMGCAFIAIGMFISALTENQIIAAVLTFASLLILYLWTDLTSFLPDAVSGVVGQFDFRGVLDSFAYYNVFDLRGLLLYITIAALFAFLTVQALRRRKGLATAAAAAIAVALTVAVNMVAGQLPSSAVEFDLTDNSLYTVSEESREYLSSLERDVELVVLAQKEGVDERIVKFLDRYAAQSDRLTLRYIDPVEHPSAVSEYSPTQECVMVENTETGKRREVPLTDMLVMDEQSYYYYGTVNYTQFDADGQLTSAVDYVTSESSNIIYLTENHGEAALGAAASDALEKANVATAPVSLLLGGKVPDDCSLLLFNQPQSDLSEDEVSMVESYLASGGQVLLLLSRDDLANFNSMLADRGLVMAKGYIGDNAQYYEQFDSPFYFNATLSETSALTSAFGGDLSLIFGAHGMLKGEPARDSISLDVFMTTSEYGFSDTTGEFGEYLLGAAATERLENGLTSRFTVITAESVVDSQVMEHYPSIVNIKLFANAATGGLEDVSAVSIPPKSLSVSYNTFSGAAFLSSLFLIILPLAILGFGLFHWLRRRKR